MRPAYRSRLILATLLWALSLAWIAQGHAEGCAPEAQPNDQPTQGLKVEGAFCAAGRLADRDRDFILWTVPQTDLPGAWKIRLQSELGRSVQLRLHRWAEGTEPTSRFYELVATPSGSAEDAAVLIAPGTYAIEVRADEPVSYRIDVAPGPKPTARANMSADGGSALALDTLTLAELATERIHHFEIKPADAKRRWTIAFNAPPGTWADFDLLKGGQSIFHTSARLYPLQLPDFGLDAGVYALKIQSSASGATPYTVSLTPSGPRIASREEEPNGEIARATRAALNKPTGGKIAWEGDVDFFFFDQPESIVGKTLSIALGNKGTKARRVCLTDRSGTELQCREDLAPVLAGLSLPAGRYGILVSGRTDPSQPYTVTASVTGEQVAGTEAEPNDSAKTATPFAARQVMTGHLVPGDKDYYRFTVQGAPQLWTVSATGRGVTSLAVIDPQGSTIGSGRALPAAEAVEARGLYLLPGEYRVSVAGEEGEYILLAKPDGAPDLSAEREPNDDDAQAHRLRFGVKRTGVLADKDTDVFRFSLAAHEHVALELTPAQGSEIQIEMEWGYPAPRRPLARVTAPITYEAWLAPGDYIVRLKPQVPTPCKYAIILKRLDPFTVPRDLEPNDSEAQARPLNAPYVVSGKVGDFSDQDWFVLPAPSQPTSLQVKLTGRAELILKDGANEVPSQWDHSAQVLSAKVGAGRALRLGVHGRSDYRVEVAFAAGVPLAAQPARPLPVTLSLDLGKQAIAPFWPRGQRLRGALTLTNNSKTSLDLTLRSRSSHPSYKIEIGEPRLSLGAGATRAVPIDVGIKPDAWASETIVIGIEAMAPSFGRASVTAPLLVDVAAAPVGQHVAFPLPKELLGGFNVAWSALGSQPSTDGDSERAARDIRHLFDGLATAEGYVVQADELPKTVTVRFGGDKSWAVRGILLQPQVEGRLYPAEQLADFELLLSQDGKQFEPALSGRLSMLPIEQAFVLAKPVEAKAAQLRLKSNHADNIGKVGLSEWKVVVAPDAASNISLNLADPDRGGHIVWSDPLIGDTAEDAKSVLVEGGVPVEMKISTGRPSFVIGFHENRAAQIVALEWVDREAPSGNQRFGAVDVDVSVDGPVGPWKFIGRRALERNDKGVARFDLAKPEWARFVRLTPSGSGQASKLWDYPIAVRVFERPTGGDYLSILGEWGQYNREAIYEATSDVPPIEVDPAGRHGSRDQPLTLELAKPVSGRVRLGAVEDWYALDVPADVKTLGLSLEGDPFVATEIELIDAQGRPVPLRPRSRASKTIELLADPAPGRYLVRVFEPPHAVAITFDTSASLSNFAPIVARAVTTFAEGTNKGREFVNFMNFGKPYLLPAWSDEAWILASALSSFQAGPNDSSDLAGTTLAAVEGLMSRPGARAIISVTDAETPGPFYAVENEMWRALELSRPHVFTAQIGLGSDPVRQKQLMQDLASVNGGRYASARTQAEMDIVAERAAAWLRRPARYRLTASKVSLPPAAPGAVAVIAGAPKKPASAPGGPGPSQAASANGAFEIVLDASGSMLQKLQGRRRIEIARDALTDLVRETIPPGTPVALRVFGDDKPGSCETHLRAPLAPIEAGKLASLIAKIMPQNGARTPIGASLRLVAQDLKEASGTRTVVLITDGEETCGADVKKDIEALRAAGFDVRVNIVGFAVDAGALKETFRSWARVGGGSYFDARDAKELNQAVKAAVAKPVRVLDGAGKVIASGAVDGGALSVPPGIYRVEVGTATAVYENVVVETGKVVELVDKDL